MEQSITTYENGTTKKKVKNTKIEIQKRSQIDFKMNSADEDNKLIMSEDSEINDYDDSHL